jgi:hypothetical protein
MDETRWQNWLSVYPPTKYLTFGVWIYLVPQYKPESVLMLGYADGTAAGLIRLLYGDVKITGVDIAPLLDNKYGVEFIQADANEFVKTCGHYDTVIVDCFNGDCPCKFITDKEFADNLIRIADYIIINTLKNADMSAYSKLRKIGVNKPTGLANLIYYYEVNRIPDLHPYK